jgi:hypothetical protein
MTFKEIAKVGGVIALLVLVLVGLIAVAAAYWWYNNGDKLLADEKATAAQGKMEGAQLAEKDCRDQAVVRHRKDSSIGGLMANTTRLLACLEASHPSPGFCTGVPDADSFTDSLKWRVAECQRLHLTDSNCGNLLGSIQLYCGSDVQKKKAAAPASLGVNPK